MRKYNTEFLQWLRQQAGRDDSVGELMGDIAHDEKRVKFTTIRGLRSRMLEVVADEWAYASLLEALLEFRKRNAPLPAAEDILAALLAVQRAQRAVDSADWDDSPYWRLKRAQTVLEIMRRKRRYHFAATRGWKFRCAGTHARYLAERAGITIAGAADRNPEVFYAGDQVVGVVVHTLNYIELMHYAREQGLEIEFLPESWHCPGCCRAALLTVARPAVRDLV